MSERYAAELCVFSRECGLGVLARLEASSFLPERPVGAAIIAALRRPHGSVVCVTAPGMADVDAQVGYYAGLAAGSDPRGRVSIIGVDDDSPRWLSTKLLDDPVALRSFAAAAERAKPGGHGVKLRYFEPSANLERLAGRLGIPADQPSSRFIPLGTKAAGRALFHEAGVPVAAGTPECHSLDELTAALAPLVAAGTRRFVLKLCSTEYGAGLGNAYLDVPPSWDARDGLPTGRPIDGRLGWDGFVAEIPGAGVLGEELLRGEDFRSPSFQGRIDGDRVRTVSTHEQVLADNGQTYAGSSFPADATYRSLLVEYGVRVGHALRARGVDGGDYGVDFIVTRHGPDWRVYGCELNLRATGTRHGFDMATALLGVLPDADGLLRVDGEPRVYLCTEGITGPGYTDLSVSDLISTVAASPLHYQHSRRAGVALHMLSALPTFGRFGATAVAATLPEAQAMLSELRTLVDNRLPAPRRSAHG